MTHDENHTSQRLPLRDRLKGVMAFRVVLVTLFLGGTIGVDVETLSSLSEPRNVALFSLIVATYVLTIIYAVLLEGLPELLPLAKVQIAVDFVLTGLLVSFTHGLDSIFVFLFYIDIINAAILAGRAPALYSAAGTTSIMLGLGVLTSAGIEHPLLQLDAPRQAVLPLYFEVTVNSVAAFLIAFLSGRLTERLGETTVELQQKRTDLAKLRALTQNILASLDSGVVTVDDSGTIIYFNQAASMITGLEPEDSYGEPLEKIFPEIADTLDDIGLPSATGVAISRPGATADRRFECEYERPDGDVVFLGFSVSLLKNSEREEVGHIVVFQDLTEIKRLEAAQKRSQRLAAVGELAASIAHEIRNPLASISGSVEMLESVADLDEQDRSLMKIILREVDRLDSLISEFLDYSRPTSLSFDETNLRELLDDVVELFERRDDEATPEVAVNWSDDEEGWRVKVDRESVRQVVWNLLNNASEAIGDDSDEPGRIRIAVTTDEVEELTYYRLVVEDSGPGLPEVDRDRIFEPFFTTKEDGSGLGLATSHRLIDEHEGRIELGESESLGGARFVIWLPKRPSGSEGSADEQLPEDAAEDTTGFPLAATTT